jgi:hypothetical protein
LPAAEAGVARATADNVRAASDVATVLNNELRTANSLRVEDSCRVKQVVLRQRT